MTHPLRAYVLAGEDKNQVFICQRHEDAPRPGLIEIE